MARPSATLANWKAEVCAWAALHAAQTTTSPARSRVLALFRARARDVHAGRDIVQRLRLVALAFHLHRRLRALLRPAGAAGDLIDLERRHDRRLLEVEAVGLARHAGERADAGAADEHGIAQHVRRMRNRLRHHDIFADRETPARDSGDAHASVPFRLASIVFRC